MASQSEDDVAKLMAEFAQENLAPFSDEELLSDFRTRGFPRHANDGSIIDLEHLASYQGIKPLINAIDKYLTKLVFGKYSVSEWKNLYTFPRLSALRQYTRQRLPASFKAKGVSDQIINKSESDIAAWLHEKVIEKLAGSEISSDKPLIILLGGIGAGKSTFNKYITNVHFPELQSSKIFASRVEYRKLYNSLRLSGVFKASSDLEVLLAAHKGFHDYLIRCLIRDLLRMCFTAVQDTDRGEFYCSKECVIEDLDVLSPGSDPARSFIEFLEESVGDATQRALIQSQLVRSLRSYISRDTLMTRQSWLRGGLDEEHTREALQYFLAFALSRGARPYLILDGFDYVQAADFLNDTTHGVVLRAVGKWIVETQAEIKLARPTLSFRPLVQLTSRLCTYEFFWKLSGFSNALNQLEAQEYHVAPPEFKDLYERMLTGLESVWGADFSRHNGAELRQMFQSVEGALQRELKVKAGRFSAIFRENTRFRVNFSRNVIVQAGKAYLDLNDDRNSVTPQQLVKGIQGEMAVLSSPQRSYRLTEILLYSGGQRFVNFIDAEKIERWASSELRKSDPYLSESILIDNNKRSGYVGNIFNYHIPYKIKEDIAFFLEKFRIVEALHQKGALSRDGITDYFHENKWPISNYFDISLALLIRESFIVGKYSIPDGLYVLEKHGFLIKERLSKQIIYLENVFFGCLWPGFVQLSAVDIVRNPRNTDQWVSASIFHLWLFLRMVLTAEAKGRAFLFEGMRREIENSVRTIVTRDASDRNVGNTFAHSALRHIARFREGVTNAL
jgi:hypothetical protein